MENQKITVVIPAYNEEKTIRDVIEDVKPYCDEVLIVIAKKSRDKTKEIVESMKVSYIIDNGKGHGEAKRRSIDYLRGGIMVFIDADGSHDPKDIPKLVNPIKEGKYDMVIGSRMLGGSDELHGNISNFIRNFGGGLVQLAINYRFGVKLTDCEDGFRALKVNMAKDLKLKANDFDIEQEMILKGLKKGYKLGEAPTHEYERKYGKSNINLFKIGWKFAWGLLKNIW